MIGWSLKFLNKINLGNDSLDKPSLEEVDHIYSYPLLGFMGFDTVISNGLSKMREDTHLEDILLLRQCTITSLKYVHKKLKYGHLVSRKDSYIRDSFSRAARKKSGLEIFCFIRQV